MTRFDGSELTFRDVIGGTVKPGTRLKTLLSYPLIDMPLEDVILQRASILQDLARLPSIGQHTILNIDRAIQKHADLLAAATDRRDRITLQSTGSSDLEVSGPDAQNNNDDGSKLLSNGALALARADAHPFWLWLESQGYFCHYLPYTIPAFLMTDTVWEVENMKDIVVRSWLPSVEEVFSALIHSNKKVNFVMDRDAWSDFAACAGQYSKLSKYDVREQVSVFQNLQEATGGRVAFSVASHKENALTKCLVSEGGILSAFLFGGYYVSYNEVLINQTLKAIHDARPTKVGFFK